MNGTTNYCVLSLTLMPTRELLLLPLVVALSFASAHAADKPKLTLDEFFNSVEFKTVRLSPDGHSVVIATVRADWEQNIFRKDLWLSEPQWSQDSQLDRISFRQEASKGR